jgi:hypothetical protein
MNSLPNLRALQLGELRKQQGIDYMLTPPLSGPPMMGGANVRLTPKSYNSRAGLDAQGKVEAMWEVKPDAVRVVVEDNQEKRERVDRSFYTPLFLAISNMPGVQPRNVEEIIKRNEEQLSQLGPVVGRVNVEKLKRVIDRSFMVLLRAGRVPPPPPEIHGQELKIKWTSMLVQMQLAAGVQGIQRTAGFVGNLLAAFPTAGDKLDVDQAIDEFAQMQGAPPSMIRSDEEVAAIREQRAQKENMERMAAMAPAANDGAQAARLLSETKVGGASALDRIMGQG